MLCWSLILSYHVNWSDKGGWAMWQPCACHVACSWSSALSLVLPSNPGCLVKCQSSDMRIPFVAFLCVKNRYSLLICKKYNLKELMQSKSAASRTKWSVTKDFILLLIWDFNLWSYSAYCHQKWYLLFVMLKCYHTLGKTAPLRSTPPTRICPIIISFLHISENVTAR